MLVLPVAWVIWLRRLWSLALARACAVSVFVFDYFRALGLEFRVEGLGLRI